MDKLKIDELMGLMTTIGMSENTLKQWVDSVPTPLPPKTQSGEYPKDMVVTSEEYPPNEIPMAALLEQATAKAMASEKEVMKVTGELVAWKKALSLAVKLLDKAQMIPPVSSHSEEEWETLSREDRMGAWVKDLFGAVERGGKWE